MKKLFAFALLFIGVASCNNQNGHDCNTPANLNAPKNVFKDINKIAPSMEHLMRIPWVDPLLLKSAEGC
jgi:hypothetical protein